MFMQRMIKVFVLILASISLMVSCKKGEAAIRDLSDMPVAIKFDIPGSAILDDAISPEKERQVDLMVRERYSELLKANRLHFKRFSDTLSYYEYSGQSKKCDDVLLFVFESPQAITISGFTSNVAFMKETRFKFIDHGLELYKRTLGNRQRSVSIFFRTEDALISFNKDDGFSVW